MDIITTIKELLNFDKNKKRSMLILISGFVVFAFIYFQVFLKANIKTITALVPEVNQLRSDIRMTMNDLDYEDILKKRLGDVEGKIDVYQKRLPSERDLPVLLGELSAMAKDSYVTIIGIKPLEVRKTAEPSKKSEIYYQIPIMITAKSGYHELGTFINKMENADRFMEVSNIQIAQDRNNFKRHDMELIVSAYVLRKE